ncbi:alpha/beta hydrolase [Mangrovimonas aestuarii]|uniref:alpha/beta hydrolase n=1 Tax=Mangrovimonas aestuarii TaxID=3018443 RepID=UPI00237A060F|nr:esterase [Mangrovimonas aestuarii]
MNSTEKEISYTTTNTYATLNNLTPETKTAWFVCHGMGYLSRYFIKYFEELNPKEHYVIAPQAQSKYYIQPKMKHVGASWLTKENTAKETENVMRYFDAVLEAENIPNNVNLIVLGYSQGVSVAMRYITKRKLNCNHLVLLSGGIPKELTPTDFAYMKDTKITMMYGNNDEYLNSERISYETNRLHELFGDDVTIIPFEGKHEVRPDLLKQIIL